jgi:hypothetical protein
LAFSANCVEEEEEIRRFVNSIRSIDPHIQIYIYKKTLSHIHILFSPVCTLSIDIAV